jgi:predicted adenine nucleotide alpha hydrolase (AANH) superfamily ATPase
MVPKPTAVFFVATISTVRKAITELYFWNANTIATSELSTERLEQVTAMRAWHVEVWHQIFWDSQSFLTLSKGL